MNKNKYTEYDFGYAPLPVADDWAENHVGEKWSFVLGFDLLDIILAEGVADMEDKVDKRIGAVLEMMTFENVPDIPGRLAVRVTGIVMEPE